MMIWKELFSRAAVVTLATTGLEDSAEVIGVCVGKLSDGASGRKLLFRQIDTDTLEPGFPFHRITPDRLREDAQDDESFDRDLASELFGYDVLVYNPGWAGPKLERHLPSIQVIDVAKLIWLMATEVAVQPGDVESLEAMNRKACQIVRGLFSVRRALRAAEVDCTQEPDSPELPMESNLGLVQRALEKLWDREIKIDMSAAEQA